ncbi:hypothetical protein TD95_003470 [Thielaviopsis punctulata]|uniref:Mitochondrial fission process protein 1 n=1 Tax=Thielaviopsis punctulata TaxID=72032 RepID=A0A0F4ZAG8_9PEZI|nr:hypothetical protein TD95_003470 [Thielaviopsis punctulata]
MWWPGKKQDKPAESAALASTSSPVVPPAVSAESKTPPHEKLPESLQKIMSNADKNEKYDDAVNGYGPDSTESNVRYAAYLSRIRTVVSSAHRYVAYTSDIGESFRPVVSPALVRAAYGVSWAYLIGDVSYEGYKAYWSNQRTLNPVLELTPSQQKWTGLPSHSLNTDSKKLGADGKASPIAPGHVAPLDDYRTVMVQRALFQSIASMGLPAFTIHSVVKYSGKAMKDIKNKTLRTWGPIGLGLSVVPFLPTLFDEPVENAVEWAFHKAFFNVGGASAVENAPATGREKLLSQKPKEKEL